MVIGLALNHIYEKKPGGGVTVDGLLIRDGVVVNLNNVENIKSNFTAVGPPLVSDDSAAGYTTGSIWINTATNASYICSNAGLGAAIWKDISRGGPIYYLASSLGENGTTSMSYVQKLQLSQIMPAGNYLLLWSCGLYSDDLYSNLRIQADSNTLYEMLGGRLENGHIPCEGHAVINFSTTATHAINMDYSEASNGATYIKYARLTLIKLAA